MERNNHDRNIDAALFPVHCIMPHISLPAMTTGTLSTEAIAVENRNRYQSRARLSGTRYLLD